MMSKTLSLLAAAGFAAALPASAAIQYFEVPLEGAQEFPGPGDPDGSGLAKLWIDDVALTIDWDITVLNVDPIAAAHIHNAPAGASGPVRVDFSGQLIGTSLFDADLAGVLANPANWYVNVHNPAFPAGAVRGQLPGIVPEASTWLGGAALAAVAGFGLWRRRK